MSDEMEAITHCRFGRPKLPGSLKSIRLTESVFNLSTDRKEVSLQCKMRLTSLHDFYGL